MSGFVAAEAVETLDYDFTSLNANGDERFTKGTIPEPSRELYDNFTDANHKIDREMGLDLEGLTEEIAKVENPQEAMLIYGRAIAAIPEDSRREAAHKRIDVIAELCQGTPPKEEIAALPFRHQEAFFGWLMGQLRGPFSRNGTSD